MTEHDLSGIFYECGAKFSNDTALLEHYWALITTNYSREDRHYHTLEHLVTMYDSLSCVRAHVRHWDDTLIALFFHDAIYDAERQDNEEQSALLADTFLAKVNADEQVRSQVNSLIMATKGHSTTDDDDVAFFIDADLGILGSSPEKYARYADEIRKEYNIYPDNVYNPGRSKVLQYFLSMPFIFKTTHFRSKYEDQAKENLLWELAQLK